MVTAGNVLRDHVWGQGRAGTPLLSRSRRPGRALFGARLSEPKQLVEVQL